MVLLKINKKKLLNEVLYGTSIIYNKIGIINYLYDNDIDILYDIMEIHYYIKQNNKLSMIKNKNTYNFLKNKLDIENDDELYYTILNPDNHFYFDFNYIIDEVINI